MAWRSLSGTYEEREDIFSTLKRWTKCANADKLYRHKGAVTTVSILRIAEDYGMIVKVDSRRSKRTIEVFMEVPESEDEKFIKETESVSAIPEDNKVDDIFS